MNVEDAGHMRGMENHRNNIWHITEKVLKTQITCVTCVEQDPEGEWRQVDIGAALEADGLGTGGAVADIDGDGRLELLL